MDRDSNREKTRHLSEEKDNDVSQDRKEKNRQAAKRCRENKGKQMQDLKQQNQELEEDNKKLADEKRQLKEQAQTNKKLVEEHCQNGCKIPDDLLECWKEMNNTMAEEISSDEDSQEESQPPSLGVFGEMHAPQSSPPHAAQAAQQLQNTLPDHDEHQFEAPRALFSGKPLDARQLTRSRNNNSSKLLSSAPVSPAQVSLRQASSSKPYDFFTVQASGGLLNSLAPVSTPSTKVVQMQGNITPISQGAVNNISKTVSNTSCYKENDPDMAINSRDIMQVQSISELTVTQPLSEVGTRCPHPGSSLQGAEQVAQQASMEYQCQIAGCHVSKEAGSHQHLLSLDYFLNPVEGYTYSEELISNAENMKSENNEIQESVVARTNGGSQFQSLPQLELNVPSYTMASAEVSQSRLQQTKTSHGSLPRQDAVTIAETDVIFVDQNITRSKVMMASPGEEQNMSSTNQFQPNVLNQHSVIASRQVGSQSKTSSRLTQEGYDQLSRIALGISANNPIKATVLSNEQFFKLKQKQTLGQSPPSVYFPAREQWITSHQQDVPLPHQVTWTSVGSSAANSTTHSNASDVYVHALYSTKPPSRSHLAAQKNTITKDNMCSGDNNIIQDNNNTVSYSQSRSNIPHSGRPNVSQKRTTHPFVPNTVTSHNGTTISSQILSKVSSDQIAQSSSGKVTNGEVSRNGHGRLVVATPNGTYISAAACNQPPQDLSKIAGANNTANIIISNVAASTNVYSNTPTHLNTQSQQFCPQINNNISATGHILNVASTNSGHGYTSSACNLTVPSDVQTHRTNTSVMTSNVHQYLTNTSLTNASLANASLAINEHPRNTQASCSSTDIVDQVFITTASETRSQPTMTMADTNLISQQGRFLSPEDHLLMPMTTEPQYTDEYLVSLPEYFDYLSESPQAIAQPSL